MRQILHSILQSDAVLKEFSTGMKSVYGSELTIKNFEQCVSGHYNTLIAVAQAYDQFTGLHLKSTEKIAAHIGKNIGLSHHDLISVTIGAVLHDIGKIGVNYAIITKPEQLTDAEKIQVRDHTVIGKKILDNLVTPWGLNDFAYMHHERLDGTGYPNRLTAEQIPITMRVLSIADVFDALTAQRPYRNGWARSDAIDYLYSNPTQFDTDIVKYVESYDPTLYKNIL